MSIFRDPPVLFFILGLLSVGLKTGLRIPTLLSRFFALYLLMAIGFKGGISLAKTGVTQEFLFCLLGGLLLSTAIPVAIFYAVRRRLRIPDAAAISATYGSVSAVTFVAATNWLESRGLTFSGSMIAVLAAMEAPAIIVGLLLARRHSSVDATTSIPKLLHESLLNGSVFLLLGSLLIGAVSGPTGVESVGPFMLNLFKGFLSFFLLDLGIKAGDTLAKRQLPFQLVPVGLITPLLGAALALFWSRLFELSLTSGYLLMTLAAGASYIAVPAALKDSIPEADQGLYMTLALGVTFPFNVVFGLPLYWSWASQVLTP